MGSAMKLLLIFSCSLAVVIAAPGQMAGRIVGGEEAAPGQFPYHAVLKMPDFPACGGSILGRYTIITSAFCTISHGNEEIEILIGSNRLSTGKLHQVSKMYQHPEYDPEIGYNSIGIVKLVEPIEFNDETQPIKISERDVAPGDTLTMTGFGMVLFPGSWWSEVLRYVNVDVVDAETCQNTWDEWMETNLVVDDSLICTNSDGKGSCLLDYGGPMANADGELVGVSFTGAPCGAGLPDLSTTTFKFRKWLVEQID